MSDEAKELLIEKGTSLEFGARPLRRAIEHLLEDPLAELLLRGGFTGKDTLTARIEEVEGEKKLAFDASATAPPPAPAEPAAAK
jgi:ATP-dependent Clp protease ATP-binding subunit ClpC